MGIPLRQMASRTGTNPRFRGSGSVADPFATDYENGSDKAARTVGTILSAGLLRPSSVLFRRPDPDGQCVDAERVETIHTSERDIYGDVNHSEDFLKERGQERTAKTNKNTSRIRPGPCKQLAGDERASGALNLIGRMNRPCPKTASLPPARVRKSDHAIAQS